MINANRQVLVTIVGLILVLLLILYFNYATTARLERIEATLIKEVDRNERREQSALSNRLMTVEETLKNLVQRLGTTVETPAEPPAEPPTIDAAAALLKTAVFHSDNPQVILKAPRENNDDQEPRFGNGGVRGQVFELKDDQYLITDHLSVGDAATLVAWVTAKPDQEPHDLYSWKSPPGSPDPTSVSFEFITVGRWGLFVDSPDSPIWQHYNPEEDEQSLEQPTQWTHIALRLTPPSTADAWVNGRRIWQATDAPHIEINSKIIIGHYENDNTGFTGLLDDIAIFDRPLEVDEIKLLAQPIAEAE